MIRRPPKSTRFPDPALFRSRSRDLRGAAESPASLRLDSTRGALPPQLHSIPPDRAADPDPRARAAVVDRSDGPQLDLAVRDRKSTRLNSSHANISYAVFCLK